MENIEDKEFIDAWIICFQKKLDALKAFRAILDEESSVVQPAPARKIDWSQIFHSRGAAKDAREAVASLPAPFTRDEVVNWMDRKQPGRNKAGLVQAFNNLKKKHLIEVSPGKYQPRIPAQL